MQAYALLLVKGADGLLENLLADTKGFVDQLRWTFVGQGQQSLCFFSTRKVSQKSSGTKSVTILMYRKMIDVKLKMAKLWKEIMFEVNEDRKAAALVSDVIVTVGPACPKAFRRRSFAGNL